MAVDASQITKVFQVRTRGAVWSESGGPTGTIWAQYPTFEEAIEKCAAVNSRSGFDEEAVVIEAYHVHTD